MKFTIAYVKSIKADIAKKEITVQVTMDFSEENIETCEQLSRYADPDAGSVTVEISPRQMAFKSVEMTTKVVER